VDEARSKNTSDSFLFLQKIILQNESNSEESIKQRISHIMNSCDYSSLIGFLMTPTNLFVWRVFNEAKSEQQEDYKLYYTLYMKFKSDALVFSSEPLDDEGWTLLPNKSFISLTPVNGKIKTNYSILK
jgi:predicted glutamine amidotransferase